MLLMYRRWAHTWLLLLCRLRRIGLLLLLILLLAGLHLCIKARPHLLEDSREQLDNLHMSRGERERERQEHNQHQKS